MKEFLKKYRKSLPFVVVFLIFSGMGLLGWFGVMPFQRFITEKADSIQEYYATKENREQQIKKLPDLQGQFERIQAEKDVLDILLSEQNIVDFVQTLERLAEETGVFVTIQSKSGQIIEEKKLVKAPVKKTAVAPVEGTADDTGKEKKGPLPIIESVPFDRYLHVEVVVQGEYKTIVSFLHKMETLPLGIDVIGMTMNVRNDKEEGVARPENPGRNPFLMLSGGEVAAVPSEQELAKKKIPGTLEASFDTVVYLDNK